MVIQNLLDGFSGVGAIEKRPICAPEVLNEAYRYGRPVPFPAGCGSI